MRLYPFEPGCLARPWKRQAAAIAMCVWMTRPVSHSALRVPLCCLFPSPSDCCSYGTELPPAAAILDGQPASFPLPKKWEKKTKKRGEKINSSLKEFVKAASKGVQHLLWHRRKAHVTLRTLGFTWQITRVPVEEESVAFVLIDRWVVAHQACKSQCKLMPGRLPVWALAGWLDLFDSALC